jgi:hypothetical protein
VLKYRRAGHPRLCVWLKPSALWATRSSRPFFSDSRNCFCINHRVLNDHRYASSLLCRRPPDGSFHSLRSMDAEAARAIPWRRVPSGLAFSPCSLSIGKAAITEVRKRRSTECFSSGLCVRMRGDMALKGLSPLVNPVLEWTGRKIVNGSFAHNPVRRKICTICASSPADRDWPSANAERIVGRDGEPSPSHLATVALHQVYTSRFRMNACVYSLHATDSAAHRTDKDASHNQPRQAQTDEREDAQLGEFR